MFVHKKSEKPMQTKYSLNENDERVDWCKKQKVCLDVNWWWW